VLVGSRSNDAAPRRSRKLAFEHVGRVLVPLQPLHVAMTRHTARSVRAVAGVLNDGATVTDVARRHGVARQTVHEWLRKYAREGMRGLADRSSRPLSCPHQTDPSVRQVPGSKCQTGTGA
jgi:hypothetical protein